MLQFLDKNIDQNASPTDSLFQHYDYDIAVFSGGNASPMVDFARGVVTIQDGRYSKSVNSKLDWNDNLAAIFEAKLVINRLSSSVLFYCFSRRG